MKSLNKTQIPIFWYVVCSLFPKGIFLTFLEKNWLDFGDLDPIFKVTQGG